MQDVLHEKAEADLQNHQVLARERKIPEERTRSGRRGRGEEAAHPPRVCRTLLGICSRKKTKCRSHAENERHHETPLRQKAQTSRTVGAEAVRTDEEAWKRPDHPGGGSLCILHAREFLGAPARQLETGAPELDESKSDLRRAI